MHDDDRNDQERRAEWLRRRRDPIPKATFPTCPAAAIDATFQLEYWTLTQAILWAGTHDRVAVTLVCDVNSPMLDTDNDPERDWHRDHLPFLVAMIIDERGLTPRDWDEWRGEVEKKMRGQLLPVSGTPNAEFGYFKKNDRQAREVTPLECRSLLLRGKYDEPQRLIWKATPASEWPVFTEVLVTRSSVLRVFPELAPAGLIVTAPLGKPIEPDAVTSEASVAASGSVSELPHGSSAETPTVEAPAPRWAAWSLDAPRAWQQREAWRIMREKWGDSGPPTTMSVREVETELGKGNPNAPSYSTIRRVLVRGDG